MKNTPFIFKKSIVVKRLKSVGRMNGKIHVFSVILITEVQICVIYKKGLDYIVYDSTVDQNGRYITLDILVYLIKD